MGTERGQATIEWTGVVLVVSLAFGAFVAAGPRIDGRSFAGVLTHSIVCAVRGGCDDGDDELAVAYGERDAALVREFAPNLVYEPGTLTLPVDYRECRSHRCSDAPDDRDLDVHRSARTGHRATAFTRVVHSGGETFIQYWLYYPDSTTTWGGSRRLWGLLPEPWPVRRKPAYPGFHEDDWEGYQVRIGRAGEAQVRATSHGHYQGCKQRRCRDRWTGWTGWTRISRGSHAGHIPLRSVRTATSLSLRPPFLRRRYRYGPLYPGRDVRERTTTAAGLRLVPLEGVSRLPYRPLDSDVEPPWGKRVYEDPRSDGA
jgi:hypothetical protein